MRKNNFKINCNFSFCRASHHLITDPFRAPLWERSEGLDTTDSFHWLLHDVLSRVFSRFARFSLQWTHFESFFRVQWFFDVAIYKWQLYQMIIPEIFHSGNNQNGVKLCFVDDGDMLTNVTCKFHVVFHLNDPAKSILTFMYQNLVKRIEIKSQMMRQQRWNWPL